MGPDYLKYIIIYLKGIYKKKNESKNIREYKDTPIRIQRSKEYRTIIFNGAHRTRTNMKIRCIFI